MDDVLIACGKNTCQDRDTIKTCPHGHGTILGKPMAETKYPPEWVQLYGRGCCLVCKRTTVGIPHLPHNEQQDDN